MFCGVYNVYATFYSYGQVFSIKLIKQAIGNTTITAFVWKIETKLLWVNMATVLREYIVLAADTNKKSIGLLQQWIREN